MRVLALAAVLLAARASSAVLGTERVVVRTDAGDLVLALYPGAPRHSAKLLALMRGGAYDTAPLVKIETRFVAVGSVDRRRVPLSRARLDAIPRLPLETGGGPNRAGVVAMAHMPGDPDASGTSFVILFANIAAMDGRFTAVGEVVGGSAVLDALRSAAVDGQSRPVRPLEIRTTSVLSPAALAKETLRGPDFAALGREDDASRRRLLLSLALLGLSLAGAVQFFRARLGSAAPSVALLLLLSGFFAGFAALADLSASTPWLSLPLFASTITIFRLMNRFERS